jgi:hypothetical protein
MFRRWRSPKPISAAADKLFDADRKLANDGTRKYPAKKGAGAIRAG